MSNPFLEEKTLDFTQMTPEQLREKQLELERREQQLQYQQMKVQEIQEKQGGVPKVANWPKCRPLIYHNIHDEIPENGRTLVKRVYFSWMFFFLCFNLEHGCPFRRSYC